MNNYSVNKDYYNYVNNNYNQPLYTENMNPNNVFDPYSGFIRGNMFPKLYNTYKTNKPFDIEPINEQADILTTLDAYNFATIDLNLYLDIYPNDKDMIELFNQYRTQKNKALDQYEKKYGPILLNSNALLSYPFSWVDKPWPWENK